MPYVTSLKLDRNKLKAMTAILDQDQLAEYSLQGGQKRAPETSMEIQLQHVWAELLKIPPKSIGRDDNFLRIGGDSIAAIQLVSALRHLGISLSVKDVFDDPRLFKVAARATEEGGDEAAIKPFSLLPPEIKKVHLQSTVRKLCDLPRYAKIEDVFPCTKLQEGLMAITARRPGSYIAKHFYRIPDYIDVDRFRSSFERTIKLCPNLRTRNIHASYR
jgi:aryl carrier-like protein